MRWLWRGFLDKKNLSFSYQALVQRLKIFGLARGLFINGVIIFGGHTRFSLQTTHVLKVYNVLSIHGWSEIKPAENDDAIYGQPLTVTMYVDCRCLLHIGNLVWFFKHHSFWRELCVSFVFGLHIHRDKRIWKPGSHFFYFHLTQCIVLH